MALKPQQESTGSGSADMKLTKFRAMVQDADRFLSGRTGSGFMFGSGKYKTYMVGQFKRYNSDMFTSVLESTFNPGKTGPLEVVDEQGLIQIYRDIKNKPGDKNFNEFYRLIFWLLFSASVNDEIYNNELSNIIDLAYCLGFDENMTRDWCKAVAYLIAGNRFGDGANLQLSTAAGKSFFLHQS